MGRGQAPGGPGVTYRIAWAPKAVRQFDDLDSELRELVSRHIDALATDPRPGPPLGKKLRGHDDRFRLRVGDYRVVYDLSQRERLVRVL